MTIINVEEQFPGAVLTPYVDVREGQRVLMYRDDKVVVEMQSFVVGRKSASKYNALYSTDGAQFMVRNGTYIWVLPPELPTTEGAVISEPQDDGSIWWRGMCLAQYGWLLIARNGDTKKVTAEEIVTFLDVL